MYFMMESRVSLCAYIRQAVLKAPNANDSVYAALNFRQKTEKPVVAQAGRAGV